MIQPEGTHLAELNWGRLRYGWEDPRVADFSEGLDLVNGAAARMPGFVWRLSDDAMEAEQIGDGGAFGADPFMASTLSVWTDAVALTRFVHGRVHSRFMARATEWFRPGESGMVLWWVPRGHRPSVVEGLDRAAWHAAHGDSAFAFGWSALSLGPD